MKEKRKSISISKGHSLLFLLIFILIREGCLESETSSASFRFYAGPRVIDPFGASAQKEINTWEEQRMTWRGAIELRVARTESVCSNAD